MHFDILVKNAIILTMEPNCEPFLGWMGVCDGRITACEAGPMPSHCVANETIDASNRILMPGLINGHCHGDMTVFRGLGDGFTLGEQCDLFNENWWFGKDLTNEDLIASRQLTYLEAIASGTTFILENMYWGVGLAAISAMRQTGIRGALSEEFRTSRDFNPLGGVLDDRYLSDFSAECRKNDLIPVMNSVAEENFSQEFLERIFAAAERNGLMLTQHVSETPWRMNMVRSRFGRSTIRYMEDIGVLGRVPLIASHAVYIDKEDRDIIRKRNVRIVNTPVCEMKIADGIAPVAEYVAEDTIIGLGTDGALWNNTNDMFGEIKYSVLLQSVIKGPRSISARQALEMATIGGARVFDVADDTGTITPGKSADFILVDASGLHMQPLQLGIHENVFSALAFCACGRDVTDTFVHGCGVMRNRIITTIDAQKVVSAASEVRKRILSKYLAFHLNDDMR